MDGQLSMVAYSCNPSNWGREGQKEQKLKVILSIQPVLGQPELHSTLSQNRF